MSSPSRKPFRQTGEYIGRNIQKEMLRHWSHAIVDEPACRALYFEAEGGLGKTRLLASYPTIVADTRLNIGIADIVDFYNFENRTSDGIERKLIEGLKATPGQDDQWYCIPSDQVNAAFEEYWQVYKGYVRARERGGGQQGEFTPQQLRQTFIKCWNDLTATQPLVMRFDTIETLYTLPAPQEAFVSTAKVGTGAEQVIEWVTQVLPHIQHTLALFSGRPGGSPFADTLHDLGLLAEKKQVLLPLDNQREVREYLGAYSLEVFSDEIPYLMDITGGYPLLLTCYAETRRPQLALPPPLPLPGAATAREGFELELINTILNPMLHNELAESTLVYSLHLLSYARRGARRDDLRALFTILELGEWDDEVIEHLDYLALVKVMRVEQSQSGSSDETDQGEQPATDELLFLHDEIHRLIDSSGLQSELGLREETIAYFASTSKQHVREKRGASTPVLLKTMTDHMYYEMTNDMVSGYRAYVVYVDWLLNDHIINEALVLSDIFWNTLDHHVKRDGKDVQPYRKALAASSALTYDQIIHDEQVDHIQMLIARGQYEDAARIAEEMYRKCAQEGILPPEDQELTPETLPKDQYLFAELSLWWAESINISQPTIGAQHAERLFSRVICFLEMPDAIHEEFLFLRRLFFLGYAYAYRGFMHRQQQRYAEAIADYERGRDAFRSYRDEEIMYKGQHVIPEVLLNDHITNDLAGVTNDLAFALSLTGNLKRAQRLSAEVLKQFIPFSSDYQKALFYSANALIRIAADDLAGAEGPVVRAEQSAKESGSRRARGLVERTHGQLERARMMAQGEPDPGIEVYYERAAELLEPEPDTLREVLYDWAGFMRDLAVLSRSHGDIEAARRSEHKSIELLDKALALLPETPSMQRADHLESEAVVYRLMGDHAQASAVLDQAEAMMHIPMPEYGQCVSGKIALQRGLIALYDQQDAQTALRLMAIALARAYVFAKQHHDQAVFERIIRQHIQAVPVKDLRIFKEKTENEYLYIQADDLPYQQPDTTKWADAWEDSIAFINDVISEFRLQKYP